MTAKTAGWLAFTALAALGQPAGGWAEEAPQFTESEIRATFAHGPWPVPAGTDPSNRVSGKREAIVLGERLFLEARLSSSGRFSCATCHVPERN